MVQRGPLSGSPLRGGEIYQSDPGDLPSSWQIISCRRCTIEPEVLQDWLPNGVPERLQDML